MPTEIYVQVNQFANNIDPFSQEAVDEINKYYKPNQVLKCVLTGTRRPRSVQQHKWAMWMVRQVSLNDNDRKWNTFDRAKKQIKLIMKFFKDEPHVDLNTGLVWFELRSFAFDKMEQWEADMVYNDIKLICAKRLGVEPQVLEANAQREA